MARRLKTRAEIWHDIKAGTRQELEDGTLLYVFCIFGGMFLFIVSLHDPNDNDHAVSIGLITMLGGYVLYDHVKTEKRLRKLEAADYTVAGSVK